MSENRQATSGTGLRSWLTERVATYTGTDGPAIDPDVPLANYGLDSVAAVSLIVDIEERYGLILEADALWEHRTVGLLSDAIAALLPAA